MSSTSFSTTDGREAPRMSRLSRKDSDWSILTVLVLAIYYFFGVFSTAPPRRSNHRQVAEAKKKNDKEPQPKEESSSSNHPEYICSPSKPSLCRKDTTRTDVAVATKEYHKQRKERFNSNSSEKSRQQRKSRKFSPTSSQQSSGSSSSSAGKKSSTIGRLLKKPVKVGRPMRRVSSLPSLKSIKVVSSPIQKQ